MARFAEFFVVILLGLSAGCRESARLVTDVPEDRAVMAKSSEKFLPRRPEIFQDESYTPYAAEIIEPDTSIDPKIIIIPPDPRFISLECRALMVNELFPEEIGIAIPEPKASVGHVVSGPANDKAVRKLLEAEPPVSTDIPLQEIETLDDLQVGFLEKEAMQRRDSRQLTAPKAVVLDGEQATMEVKTAIAYTDTDGLIKEFTKGVRIAARPTLEDDGKTIRLRGTFRMIDVTGWEVRYAGDQEFSIPIVEIYEVEFHRLVPTRATVLLGSALSTAKTEADAVSVRRLLLLVKPTVIDETPQPRDEVRPPLPDGKSNPIGAFQLGGKGPMDGVYS